MKVYDKPGCHAVATFQQAVDAGMRAGYPVAIMECAHDTPYDTGWHRIALDAVEHWAAHGYILRAKLLLQVVHHREG